MSVRISSLVVAVLGAGCMTDAGEPAAIKGSPLTGDCDAFMCGTNSPQIAEFGFWDLKLPTTVDVPGQRNNVGLQVLRFEKNTVHYLPRVHGGRLSAIDPATGAVLSGSALINGWLYLQNVTSTGTRFFRLRVVDVSSVGSWAVLNGQSVALESYTLDWAEFQNGSFGRINTNVCKNPPERTSPDLLTMTGDNIYRTLLFEGDRIDAAHKLDTGVDVSWFNLGCAGSALAKMALTGHTQASQVTQTFFTTLAERTTMLKMLTADYCGDGMPFTVAGQSVDWRDDHGTMQFYDTNPPEPPVLEARWTSSGAVCLSGPRVDVHWSQLGSTTFGTDVRDQVLAHCPQRMLQPCPDSSFATDGYHLLTATVPLPPP